MAKMDIARVGQYAVSRKSGGSCAAFFKQGHHEILQLGLRQAHAMALAAAVRLGDDGPHYADASKRRLLTECEFWCRSVSI